ncbi:MAG: 16S rRNA (guanine(527)-N(7))-methyltransferase RsmG [Chloroflexi bacterium]|nr:16S rRNA (guanine(527)-N(7))-methyltransferase RsmG [Chloroflexota bacterium]
MQKTEAESKLRLLTEGARAIGVELSAEQEAQFAKYAHVMLVANTRMNLTSITKPEAVETLHFLDSLTVACVLTAETLRGGRVLDVGSGAGLPGVALKIAFPGIRLDLLETTGKKVAFLRDLVAHLELPDVTVQHGRAEDLAHDPSLRASFDAVLARGVAKLPALAELTLPFLRAGGVLVAHKKDNVGPELAAAAKAVQLLGGAAPTLRPVSAPGLEDGRALVVVEKIAATPKGYPRQAGMPVKRPIGT